MARDRASVRLTPIKVGNAKPHHHKRIEIPDAGKPGLYLVIQPSGRKSWAVRYRRLSDRVTRKYTLPGFPSLAVAHKMAQAALDRAAEGHDPAAAKQAEKRATRERSSDFIEGVFKAFLERHVRRKDGKPIRETTRRETARLLGFKRNPNKPDEWIQSGGGVLSRWRGRTVQSVKAHDVRDLLDDLVKTAGPVAANRTLTALKTCFSWRVKRDSETLPKSPCDDVDDPSPEVERERALSDQELAALWRAADAAGYPFGRMVQLLVLSGCRRDEVRDASWSEFDLPGRTWLIPSHRTKNSREHLLPLADKAMDILTAMPRIKGKGLLFTTTGETPISGIARCKRRVHNEITRELGREPERWTLHDLRRTFVTGLQRLGFPLEVAEAVVNHKSGTVAGVTGVYARHDYAKEKREALDAWARHVEAIVSGKPATVIPLKARVQ